MKVLILAGGFGSRLSEESALKPKPMVEIGGYPILWHIMKIYSSFGYNEFVILLGYKGYVIKEFFANYFIHNSNVTIDLTTNKIEVLNSSSEPWKVTLLDTGLNTMTGGRIKQARKIVGDSSFLLTYGDGVGSINIDDLVKFHLKHGRLMTMTSCQPSGRFGALEINKDNLVTSFQEKPKGDGSWINAGFFVCNSKVFDYIDDDKMTIFEQKPLEDLANDNEIYTFKHEGFWMPMDTLRDKNILNEIWSNNSAEWKVWS